MHEHKDNGIYQNGDPRIPVPLSEPLVQHAAAEEFLSAGLRKHRQ